MATDLIGYIFSFSFFISRGLFECSPLNDLDNDRYLHADLIHFCCCSNSAYLATANSTFLLHLENLSVAVYLRCVYARCSIARLFITYLTVLKMRRVSIVSTHVLLENGGGGGGGAYCVTLLSTTFVHVSWLLTCGR